MMSYIDGANFENAALQTLASIDLE